MSLPFRPLSLSLWALLCATSVAEAQDFSRDVLQPDAFEDDPIGAGDTLDLDRVPLRDPHAPRPHEPDPTRGPVPPDLDVREGKVLTGVPAVHATDHRVHVQLGAGLARVDEVVQLANRGSYPAEIRYRLAVPPDAELAAFAVCIAERCRHGRLADSPEQARQAYDAAVRARGEGQGDGQGPTPVGYAERITDGRGRALRLWGAPVPSEGWLELRVAWVAPAPVIGGTARLSLPARGRDARAAPASVTVQAEDLLSPTIDGSPAVRTPVRVPPWRGAEVLALQATASSPRGRAWSFPCGERRCVRAWVTAGPTSGEPRDLILLIDASPSTFGSARGRIAPAVATLLQTAPAGTRARAMAFASRARVLAGAPTSAARMPMEPIAAAVDGRLGAATRFDAAWPMVRQWAEASRRAGRQPHVVVVGDGGLTQGEAFDAAIEEARRLAVPVHGVNVGDRPARPGMIEAVRRTGGLLVHAAEEANGARRDAPEPALAERLAVLFAPVVSAGVVLRTGGSTVELGDLRAGEALIHEGTLVAGAAALVVDHTAIRVRPAPPLLRTALGWRRVRARGEDPPPLVAVADADLVDLPDRVCGAQGPARRPGGVSSDEEPVALASPRTCDDARRPLPSLDPPDDPLAGRGMPATTVRTMLRQRVLPVARRCLRRERRGRADHSVRAVYVFRLSEREVVEARVEGSIPEELRRCLLGAVDRLNVPPFEGVVAVRYPIYTERAPEPPQIDLEAPVAEEVGRVIEGQPSEPRQPE